MKETQDYKVYPSNLLNRVFRTKKLVYTLDKKQIKEPHNTMKKCMELHHCIMIEEFYLEQMTVRQIASKWEISEGQVESYKQTGIKNLRRLMFKKYAQEVAEA